MSNSRSQEIWACGGLKRGPANVKVELVDTVELVIVVVVEVVVVVIDKSVRASTEVDVVVVTVVIDGVVVVVEVGDVVDVVITSPVGPSRISPKNLMNEYLQG